MQKSCIALLIHNIAHNGLIQEEILKRYHDINGETDVHL